MGPGGFSNVLRLQSSKQTILIVELVYIIELTARVLTLEDVIVERSPVGGSSKLRTWEA